MLRSCKLLPASKQATLPELLDLEAGSWHSVQEDGTTRYQDALETTNESIWTEQSTQEEASKRTIGCEKKKTKSGKMISLEKGWLHKEDPIGKNDRENNLIGKEAGSTRRSYKDEWEKTILGDRLTPWATCFISLLFRWSLWYWCRCVRVWLLRMFVAARRPRSEVSVKSNVSIIAMLVWGRG